MSDYHVLNGNKNGQIITYQLIFHLPVPDEVNAVGKNYRTIVATFFDQSTSIVPNILAPEQGQLDAGQLFEEPLSFTTHINGNTAAYLQQIEDWYTDRAADFASEVVDRFKFTGKQGDVA